MYVRYTEPVWEERARARGQLTEPRRPSGPRRIQVDRPSPVQHITVIEQRPRAPSPEPVIRVIERRRVYVRVYVYFGRHETWNNRFGHFDLLVDENWTNNDIKDAAERDYSQTIDDMLFVEQKYQSNLAFEGTSHTLFEKTLLFYVHERDLNGYRNDVKPFIRSINAA
ncbi:hypothetical protein IW140_003376 [Coemansia sp. RSA 1813]|nr:hypothetical protein EV178_003194 [Coemansia sp. RSA 1646]KAJ1771001.1 hypothetical protein LPJ74_002692 [Coemansia sp. RSA 1843]KAJ2089241.1 hypothetical protein IW138_003561 [Coemansia sp. RSA 986]KAJ2215070.1 hypothetical protein EV179_002438 [Coemansia sp. RSA 487]KAJ2569011.1 hypothetical protein IW140_003376 [Coemansia sp. RSA 1813]